MQIEVKTHCTALWTTQCSMFTRERTHNVKNTMFTRGRTQNVHHTRFTRGCTHNVNHTMFTRGCTMQTTQCRPHNVHQRMQLHQKRPVCSTLQRAPDERWQSHFQGGDQPSNLPNQPTTWQLQLALKPPTPKKASSSSKHGIWWGGSQISGTGTNQNPCHTDDHNLCRKQGHNLHHDDNFA